MTRCVPRPIRALLIGAPVLLAAAFAYAPRLDPRVVGAWRGSAGGDPLLILGKDGAYTSVDLTQTKTIPPEKGTYGVLPLPPGRARGRLAGAETVRFRHVLSASVARTLHRDPVVIRDLTFVPSIPALVAGNVRYLPEKDTQAADSRYRRWLRSP